MPNKAQLQLVHTLGTTSQYDQPDKLAQCQAALFELNELPVVAGCAA